MKKTILLAICVLFGTVMSFAQSKNSFKYQAVLRAADNQILSNENLTVRISIVNSNDSWDIVYSEEHDVKTTEFGMVHLNIGEGTASGSLFSEIDWSIADYSMQIEIKRDSEEWVVMGIAPLLSVPYALHAQTVTNSNDADASPINEIQDLILEGTNLKISNNEEATVINLSLLQDGTEDSDADPENEIQDLQLVGNSLIITNNANATEINLAPYMGENTDEQSLYLVGDSIGITNGNVLNLSEFKDNKDEQQLQLLNQTLSIDNGNSVDLSSLPDAVNDADADPVNEIQDLNLTGSTLKITNNSEATEVDLSPFLGENTDEQYLYFEGDSLGISNGNLVDLSLYKDNTDEQQLHLDDQTLSIDNGNSVDLSNLPDSVNDADADPLNEIQDLSLIEHTLTITKNQNATALDLSIYLNDDKDEQILEISNDSLLITNGNFVDLSSYRDNTDEQQLELSGNELSITNGNTIILNDNTDDADSNPENEIQDLLIRNDSILITGGNGVSMPNGLALWQSDGTNLLLPAGNLGLGIASPTGKLEVKGNALDTPNDLLFGVMNNQGDTVFAVYQGGVRIYVDDSPQRAIGSKGGFAVGGISSSKGTMKNEFLRVTPDSVRIYVKDDAKDGKTVKGGFAVGGISSSKGVTNEFLRITPDSARIYFDNGAGKAVKGGFAVGGISSSKGDESQEFLRVTSDSVRVYIREHDTKTSGSRGGFAVNGIAGSTKSVQSIMYLEPDNYFIGHQAGVKNTEGVYNTFLGYQSGIKHVSGNNNIYIGYQSAFNDLNGENNIFIGHKTGYNNTIGGQNVFLGDSTGYNNTDGSGHVFLGHNAGLNNTTGSENTFVGYQSGQKNTSGDFNAFYGNKAGYSNVIGDYNAFFGSNAGYSVTGGTGLYTGSYNAFFGSYSGYHTTTGFANVFIGPYAGYENTTGRENVFVGLHAGRENTEGYYNTFVGKTSGYYNTTGYVNTFLGFDAGLKNTLGAGNTFLGASSGNFNTEGSNNTFVGNGAGANATTGSGNVYVGANSGIEATGSNNVFIGTNAGKNTTVSNVLYIDNTDTATPLIYGNFADGEKQVTINGHFVVNNNANVLNSLGVDGNFFVNGSAGGKGDWIIGSDKRLKTKITCIPNALDRVLKLRGVNFYWKDSIAYEAGMQMGFIAQEAKDIIPEVVEKNSEFYSMKYASIAAILVEAVKEQQKIINNQERLLEKQEQKNQELMDKFNALEKRLLLLESSVGK